MSPDKKSSNVNPSFNASRLPAPAEAVAEAAAVAAAALDPEPEAFGVASVAVANVRIKRAGLDRVNILAAGFLILSP